jgi:hypothetical protein
MLEKGPCLALYSPGGRVTSRSRERVLAEYARSLPYNAGHVQLPN